VLVPLYRRNWGRWAFSSYTGRGSGFNEKGKPPKYSTDSLTVNTGRISKIVDDEMMFTLQQSIA